jgi:hypothetical protein
MSNLDYKTPNSQIENRNFSYPTKYRFTLARAPKAVFFANSANIPGLNLAIATQPTSLGRDIPQPGNKLAMEDFTLRFIVDEDLNNYIEINRWLRGLGYPQSLQQIYDLQTKDKNIYNSINSQMNIYSDGTLQVLNSNDRPTIQIKFLDLFPFSITPLVFDSTVNTTDPFMATVNFKYTYFEFLDKNGRPYETQ